MQDFELIREQDLVDNPSARVAVCLCLDVSGSMTNYNAIHELNEGIAQFYEAIKNDEEALYAAEVCIVTFGGNNRRCAKQISQHFQYKVSHLCLLLMVIRLWVRV